MTLRNAFADLSTEATLAALKTSVDGLLTNTQLRATAVPVSGTFWPGTQPVSFTWAGLTNAELRASAVPVSGTFWQATQPISAASLPLPSGAATEATLSALNTKTPALGQAVMASSQPVVIASNQSAVPVSGTFWQSTQPVSFAWAGLTNAELRATALPVSGTFWQATQPVSIASMPSTPVTGTFWQATQPVSIASWGGLTDTQLRATALPVSLGSTTISNTVAVSGPVTDAQLRATALPVSGTFWQATQPISASTLPLPAGAATESSLSSLNGKVPALVGGRIPVVLPAGGGGLTDSELRASALEVVALGLPLPTGAATETTLAGMNAKLPALNGGRIPVELPPGGSGLTDLELRAEPLAVVLSSDDVQVLSDILQALGPLMSARGTDGSLRIQAQSGTLTSITTVGTVTTVSTVTTVTTVATLSNQTAIGGQQAVPHIPSLMNIAAASNIDRMVG
jgi:hypothetical protein